MKKFSRTAVVGWIVTVLGLLSVVGLDLPVDKIETLLNSITGDAMELYMLISGPVMLWLRKITKSPVAKGVRGFLGLKEEGKK